ncbi:sensor histidine kinase [Hyphomicrobium nitrativorans]|uniref:sensor histidine kinase n=1 Tax=Hyphomicrobium nitrativorans TaxID=1427356 RepID=UPI0009DC9D0F
MYGWRGFLGRILDPFRTTVFGPLGDTACASVQVSPPADVPLPSVDHLVWVLDEVLEQARLLGPEPQTEPVDVRALLAQIVGRYDADRVLLAPVPWPVFVLAKPPVLTRVFEILLDTAVGSSTRATVRLDRGLSAMVAHVDDNGPGVPRCAREVLLARPAPHEGRGDTLATARLIARAMHGDVTISSSPEGGARFTVRLPIVPDGLLEYAAAS